MLDNKKFTESEEFKLIKENINSINNYIEKTWQVDESIIALSTLSTTMNLEKIVRLNKGMRSYIDDGGYLRTSNEEISSEFFMIEMLNSYNKIIKVNTIKPTLIELLIDIFKKYDTEDLEFILNDIHTLSAFQLPIYNIITAYKIFNNELSKENQDYILSKNELSLGDIHSRTARYLSQINILHRHYTLSKTDSEIFKLDICKISDKVSKPNIYIYDERNYHSISMPNYSFQLVENLIYNEKDFYIKSVKNNDGVIEFITNKDETISFLEYKEIALELLAKYHNYIGELILSKTEDIKLLASNKIESTNDFITLLRNYRKGE